MSRSGRRPIPPQLRRRRNTSLRLPDGPPERQEFFPHNPVAAPDPPGVAVVVQRYATRRLEPLPPGECHAVHLAGHEQGSGQGVKAPPPVVPPRRVAVAKREALAASSDLVDQDEAG